MTQCEPHPTMARGLRRNTALPGLLFVSGMSGAGRSTAAKCLEDLGWFVVDNLPPALIPT
ncbi:RNase adapter RapZ, partial [Streptomyces sp. NPDC126514]|uniref:RNase adapter RapZ n=1 Tax=Streptomyces sp. NPDC126514 TaxID=3155210 RepID=UPI00331B88FF